MLIVSVINILNIMYEKKNSFADDANLFIQCF
jgi:hypothetical protein